MAEKPTPRWRPLADLPIIASMLDPLLHDAAGQSRTLLECRPQPSVLDDHTVARVIRVFTEQQGDLPLYGEHLARWANKDVPAAQRQELERLDGVLGKLREVGDAILVLADELKQRTIDRVLSKVMRNWGWSFS